MHLVSSARNGWCCHPLELLHQEVPERAFCPHCWGLRVAPSLAQGHECFEAHEATRSFLVLKNGPCHGKFIIISFNWVQICLLSFFFFLYGIALSSLCRLPRRSLWLKSRSRRPEMMLRMRSTSTSRLKSPWGQRSKSARSWPPNWLPRRGKEGMLRPD